MQKTFFTRDKKKFFKMKMFVEKFYKISLIFMIYFLPEMKCDGFNDCFHNVTSSKRIKIGFLSRYKTSKVRNETFL